MNIAAIITGAAAAGIRMKIVDDRLVLSADQRPHDVLLGDLRREKPRIMEYMRSLAAWTQEDWQAHFDERAAIMDRRPIATRSRIAGDHGGSGATAHYYGRF